MTTQQSTSWTLQTTTAENAHWTVAGAPGSHSRLAGLHAVMGLRDRVEARRLESLTRLDADSQSALGQFFTPDAAAQLIASMLRLPREGNLRVLDPGAGTGSLSAALIARIIEEQPGLEVDLLAVEIDAEVAATLEETLVDCADVARQAGTLVRTRVVVGDYFDVGPQLGDGFDIVIMNPPYGKIGLKSEKRRLMFARGVDTPNLYAAFMSSGVSNLADGGQIVAITPRSFANGSYFEQFRIHLLDRIALDRIHTFDSRSTVFSDNGVLQENIVVAGTKHGDRQHVLLSASKGHEDALTSRRVSYDEVVHPDDEHRFVRVPSSLDDSETVQRMLALPETLGMLGLTASTGRVVDFRSRDQLRAPSTPGGTFPMVYPVNIRGGAVDHPLDCGKPQFFSVIEDRDAKLLVPGGHYVLVKRFSAKEERRRIVAATWSPSANSPEPLAIDNKLNYVHRAGAGLDPDLAAGLALWLNSTFVDLYFRTFSGHTQVNATDLRMMRFPPLDVLRQIGRDAGIGVPTQREIDRSVEMVIQSTGVSS